MKMEISIEEKAKRYDEALKQIKECTPDENGFITIYPQEIFPELKESESERIRRELLEHCKNQAEPYIQSGNKCPQIQSWIAWLDKQDEQKKCSDTCDSSMMDNKKSPYGEKRDFGYFEEKPTDDKFEPKFNFSVGQWIVATGKCVYLITKIDGFNVTLVDVHGDEYVFDASSLDDARQWTVQDAKDGDVLFHSDSASNGIFIFKEIVQRGNIQAVVCYCDYDSEDGFCLGEKHTCCWTNSKILHPATKEQRDLLFQKMKEAGYEWDAEMKEPKKIEQNPVWSEEDEKLLDDAIGAIDAADYYTYDDKQDIKNWLKALKERYTWKPSDEQMIELRRVISGCSYDIEPLVEIEEHLKKLKG